MILIHKNTNKRDTKYIFEISIDLKVIMHVLKIFKDKITICTRQVL